MLLGRAGERQELDRLLGAVRKGWSGAVLLRGEAGIGKTALLEHAISSAEDLQVVCVVAVESEMDLGFAGLQQLLTPFMSGLERLPTPQREALGSALGLLAGDAPDLFLVSLAALTLLANAAAEQPVLCVFDDAQWIDQASAGTLGFVARRLFADGIGMLFAIREPSEQLVAFEGLTELHVGGLPDADARELLASVAGGRLEERVGERILSEARGNPLALIELGGELTPGQLAGTSRLPEPLPLGSRLEERFLGRVRMLPAGTQTLLLLAAADPSGDPVLLWHASGRLGLGIADATRPEVDRMLTLEPRVVFRHPLIRSAVYQGASPLARRAAHDALAAACDPKLDPDRRAWHLAAASVGPCEEVAAELEHSADRARARGGWASAAAFLERAAELTAGERLGASRRLAAAQANLMAGDPVCALRLLEQATPQLDDPLGRAQARRLEAQIQLARGEPDEAPSMLLEAARALEPLDAQLARETLLSALEASLYARQFAREGPLDVARAGRAALSVPASERAASDLLLEGFATGLTEGYAAAVPLLQRAIAALRAEQLDAEEGLRRLGLGVLAATALLDDEAAYALASRWVGLAREQGALTILPIALAHLANFGEAPAGHLAAAETSLARAHETSPATANRGLTGSSELLALAWAGREADTRRVAASVRQEALQHGVPADVTFVQHALTVLELGLSNYQAALSCALEVYEDDDLFMGTQALPELVEAAVRGGARDVAAHALERLSERANASGTELALGVLARSRALLARDADAETLYREALEHLKHCRSEAQQARAHLLYGEWLRRRRRRRDARAELRTAHGKLESIGAEAFAERARVELLATGERVLKRTAGDPDELTPQEERIARLAGEGASNQEIATQLFISSSTVAYHLRKVFRKLDISSRAQLARMTRGHTNTLAPG